MQEAYAAKQLAMKPEILDIYSTKYRHRLLLWKDIKVCACHWLLSPPFNSDLPCTLIAASGPEGAGAEGQTYNICPYIYAYFE
jgi:hypothetical protein